MILKQIPIRWYHIRKPRVITENKASLFSYRNQLRQARKTVHLQAKQYQQMIEDQYLQKHGEQMKLKHFNNQCDFRKKIAQQGFRLQENIETWKKQDQKSKERYNKYLHDEDLKRMNRQRIKKIMKFQSQNYWFTGQNAQEKLTDEVIFPQYVASTEYYHRLHSQALAYENYDFKMLHRLRSNEEVIKEKNKLLIPIFNSLKIKIRQYKTDKQKEINYLHQIELDKINVLQNIKETQRAKLISNQNDQHSKKLKQFKERLSDPIKRQNFIKSRLRILLSIFNSWKEYTNILGMTSGQMMKEIEQGKRQFTIAQMKQGVINSVKSVKNTTFIDAIEEDTEDVQITLEDYISKLKNLQVQPQDGINQKEAIQNIELDGLLTEAQNELKAVKTDLTKPSQPSAKLDLGGVVSGIQNPTQLQISQIPMSYLNVNQTTSSIQVLKQLYKKDEDMNKLLNQIGQVTIQYPSLLQTIWKNTHSLV